MPTIASMSGWPFGSQPASLHWLGPIVAGLDDGNPQIAAEFVPYKSSSRDADALRNPRNYAWNRAWHPVLPVGYLPKLITGSMWTAGSTEDYPEYEALTVDVNVRFSRCWLMAPRDRTLRGNPIIPRSVYPISREVGKSAVFVVPVRGPVRALVIPCVEVLGYYYAPSSKLAEALFDGTWLTRPLRLIGRQTWFDYSTMRGKLYLGKYADDDDVIELARMLISPVGRAESKSLIMRASVQAGDQKQYPVVIRPPFEGQTQWTVRGMRYKIDQHEAFLVFRIESCTAPMPWNDLKYNRNNPGRQGRDQSAFTRERGWAGSYRKLVGTADGASIPIVGGGPSNKDIPTRVPGSRDKSRYHTQLNVRFDPRGPIEVTGASAYGNESGIGQKFALGTGAPGSRYRAVSFVAQEREMPSKLAAFRSAIRLIESVDPDIVLLDENIFDFAEPWESGERPAGPWAYLDHYLGQEPRRAAVARVRWGNTPYMLIDIESRLRRPRKNKIEIEPVVTDPTQEEFAIAVLRSPVIRAMTDGDRHNIMKVLIRVRGIVSGLLFAASPYSAWRHATLKHKNKEPSGVYAKRMIAVIRGSSHF